MRYTSFLGQGVMIGAICMTGLLSACGDKEPATQNIVNTDNTNTKTIKVAVNSGMSPFAYIDEKGNPIGFDVELITHIAQKNGYAVKFNVLPGKRCLNPSSKGRVTLPFHPFLTLPNVKVNICLAILMYTCLQGFYLWMAPPSTQYQT